MLLLGSRHSTTDGPLSVEASSWEPVLAVVMAETATLRAALHRSSASGRCDLQVRLPVPGRDRFGIDGDCPCRDLIVDMLVEAHHHLASHPDPVRNPPGAVRVHLRTRATKDWIRTRRLAMGAQARCDRIRNGARARGLPDEFHRALLEYLVDEAGSPAPLDGHESLLLRLATRCATEFGGEPGDHLGRVRTGFVLVERHCRTGPRVNAGSAERPESVTWWERYIERPLGRRPRRSVGTLPDDTDGVPAAAGPDDDGPGQLVDHLVVDQLVDAIRRGSTSPTEALCAALDRLAQAGLVSTPDVDSLLHDELRLERALRELAELA